ncbi:hypothetical protein SUGI_0091340 [Cryptomeria japonica]|nr:hypothetical protein SUGI_0091340 [Cryptomeria japonica]
MCICFDICMAYKRGAKWLPGYAVVIYALCLQLVGYLDVQNVSTARYLLPNLASTNGVWTNLVALLTSLSTHIAIELSVALQSRDSEKDKVVKGQSRIWVIVSDGVMLQSILQFAALIGLAIVRGRFIRDNLGSRIPLALESPEITNETISWDFCQPEMLKSWIVARVCQPEYVLIRSPFSLLVLCLVTLNVVFMGVKVMFLRSQLQRPFPLFTIQCIFSILGWFVVSYRCFIIGGWFSHPDESSWFGDVSSITRYAYTIMALLRKIIEYIENSILFSSEKQEEEEEDEDFSRYRVALERVCMQKDTAKWLWVANKSSFDHIKKCIEWAHEKGRNCEKLQKVIGSRLAQNTRPSEDVKALLEPLESVKMYFPLLKDSFRRITAFYLLRMVKRIDYYFISEDQDSMREVNADVRTAFEKSEELMDFLDCPDNVGISLDVFNISNLEAFVLRTAEVGELKSMYVDFTESSTVANLVEKLCNEAENKLKMYKLLGDFNSDAVDTDWSEAAEPYVVYKICKIILDRRPTENVEQLQNHLINMVADLIAMCVTESPKVLVDRSKKWAAEFKEDKISAAIDLSGFACGVIDGVYAASPSTHEHYGGLLSYPQLDAIV